MKTNNIGGVAKLPNLLIAGVTHGGTTSLFTYLSSHPEICASTIKETHYFSPILNDEVVAPVGEYQRFFRHHENEIYIMEAGPGYLFGGSKLTEQVKELLGDVRLLFILREPVSRLYSYFKYCNKALQISDISFRDFVEFIENQPHHPVSNKSAQDRNKTTIMRDSGIFETLTSGFYAESLTDWYNTFNKESIKIVFFDDLKKNPADMIASICQWLSIDFHLHAESDFTVENKGFYYKNKKIHRLAVSLNEKFEPFFRRYPSLKQSLRKLYMLNAKSNPFVLDPVTKEYLEKRYAPHNRQLYTLLRTKGYSREQMPDWLKKDC